MPFTVLVTANTLAPAGLSRLEQSHCNTLFAGAGAVQVHQALARHPVDAVISRTIELTKEAIDACATLKIICKHGVGVNNIDVAAASAKGIPVFVTPGANARSVAEMTVGLMLAAARKINWLDREVREGRWSRAQDGLELCGRTVGLLGLGQIGRRVAHACQALSMRAIAFDPALEGHQSCSGVELMPSLEALLAASDVLSLHLPLNSKTRGLIGADQLALLPKGAVIVNTARGEIIDEAALVSALRSGHIYAAGLDTMQAEPLLPSNPLATLPNVVLTPHVGGSTAGALNAMAVGAVDTVLGFLSGDAMNPAACVNPDVLVARHSIPL